VAISENALIDFFGTTDPIDAGSTTAITSSSFTLESDVTTWTNDDDAPFCILILTCQWGTAPDDGSTIDIYARRMNIDGTADSPKPSTVNLDQLIGSFTVDGDTAATNDISHASEWLVLPNMKSSQEYDFYLHNRTGQDISANWDLDIIPATRGPHPA
jgi:hypothetical protein